MNELNPDEKNYEETWKKSIMDKAEHQPGPLENEGMYDDFFKVIADVWQVADKFNLSVPFTNFVMFGPQSSGKTTLTERILRFPDAVVKSGIGTTRPMVVTTRRAETERVEVKAGENESFYPIEKEAVMNWVQKQMRNTGHDESGKSKISKDRIFIEVSGKDYKNRRFVDLPGFQSVGEKGTNTRKVILALLKDEMKKPNTVVVCVEDSTQEFVNSNLVKAMNEVFGKNFADNQKLRERVVFAFNKTDLWLSSGGVTGRSFLERLHPYVEGCGLVPVLVGASIDTTNSDLIIARSDGTAKSEDIVNGYREANDREAKVYDAFLEKVTWQADFTSCLKDKFLGFDTLLRTIDALVVRRDIQNLSKIAQDLYQLEDKASQDIRELRQQVLLCSDSDKILLKAQSLIKECLNYLAQLATADFGQASETIAGDTDYIDTYGNDAIMEEMEFVFGTRNDCGDETKLDKNLTECRGGYYKPDLKYIPTDKVDERWCREIDATIKELNRLKNDHSSFKPVSYLDTPLIGGQMYERALGVWAASAYRLVFPTEDDRKTLANLVGTGVEGKDPQRFDWLKTKRLASTYVYRLTPAVHFLCQKIEFLLLKNFDTAWDALLRTNNNESFVKTIGKEELKIEIRKRFQQIVRGRARIAYRRCISDLHNEAQKFFPYTGDSAPSAGMMLAYPNEVPGIQNTKGTYISKSKEFIKNLLPELFPEGPVTGILKGIGEGLDIIAEYGSIDPLLFSGLLIVQKVFLPVVKALLKKPNLGEANLEDRDMRLLGHAAALYANFLPRFIATVDARMRTDLWRSVKETQVELQLETYLMKSPVLKNAKGRAEAKEKELVRLKEQKEELGKARSKCENTAARYQENAQPDRSRHAKDDGIDEKFYDPEPEGVHQTLDDDDDDDDAILLEEFDRDDDSE